MGIGSTRRILALTLAIAGVQSGFTQDQYHDFSGDYSGVDVQYAGPDNLYVTTSQGTISPDGIRVVSRDTPHTDVRIGYDTAGNISSNPGAINNVSGGSLGSGGVYVETESPGIANSVISIRNAATINALGFGVEYLVASNGSASFYNAAQGTISAHGGVRMNLRNGGTSSFTNDGNVSSVGDESTLHLEGTSQPGQAASVQIINNGKLFSDGGLTTISAANQFSNISITNSQTGTIQSTYAYAINLLGNASGDIGSVKIENSGRIIAAASSVCAIVHKANHVEIVNTATGELTGSVRVEYGEVFTFVNEGTVHGNTASDAIASHNNAYTMMTNHGVISRRINVDGDDNTSRYNIKNYGTIDGLGNDAVYLNGANGIFEYMSGAAIHGALAMRGDSNTFIIHGGANKIGGIVDLASNTLLLIMVDAVTSGKLEAADFINLDGSVTLSLDVSGASFLLYDSLTIVQSDTEVLGGFLGLANGDMFWSGNYQFQIAYNTDTITLDVVQIIPEPATAMFLGTLVLAMAFCRRRDRIIFSVQQPAF